MACRLTRTLAILQFIVFIGSVSSQDGDTRSRCREGCVTPVECPPGYFYRRHLRDEPFSYCCYVAPLRRFYASRLQRLRTLDCRFRDISNFLSTEISVEDEHLDLSFNELNGQSEFLRDHFLQYFSHLKVLTVSSSKLNELPSNFLSNNPGLTHLILSWNAITVLPEDLLDNNKHLVRIDLSGNQISILPKRLFQHTPNVKEIVLGNNKLKYLTSEHFAFVPNLRSIDISYNPTLECISPAVFHNNNNLAFVRLLETGLRVQSSLQKTFCDRGCEGSIATLRSKLQTYLNGLLQFSPDDPCFDPAHWTPWAPRQRRGSHHLYRRS